MTRHTPATLAIALSLSLVTLLAPAAARNQTPTATPTPPPYSTYRLGALYASDDALLDSLPLGVGGSVETVAARVSDDRGSAIVIVRNTTGQTVQDISARVAVRDDSGSLVGAGASTGFRPRVVPAGGLALAVIPLEGPALGDTLDVSVSSADFVWGSDDLVVLEAAATDGAVIGFVRNPEARPLRAATLTLVCFEGDGAISSGRTVPAPSSVMTPGQDDAFSIVATGPCDAFLLAGGGST